MAAPGFYLDALFDIETVADGVFKAANPSAEGRSRIHGGQAIAHALIAAHRTVPGGWPAHSLHSYFFEGMPMGEPVELHVAPVRNGRSFASRRILCAIEGREALEVLASFARPASGTGPSHQPPMRAPIGPDQDARHLLPPRPIDAILPFEIRELAEDESEVSDLTRYWARLDGSLPDSPIHHAAALVILTDMRMSRASVRPVRAAGPSSQWASLDHAVWFHQPIRADAWVYVEVRTAAYFAGRGLVVGMVYDEAGNLGLTFTQDMLQPIGSNP